MHHLNSPHKETVDDRCSYLDQPVGVSGRVVPGYVAFHLRLAVSRRTLSLMSHMSPGKRNGKRIFTPSDDALIREQPVSGVGLKTLETMLRTSRETLMRRADELGVSLVSRDDHDEAVDTRTPRCTDGLVDPLLERLKRIHGDRM